LLAVFQEPEVSVKSAFPESVEQAVVAGYL
jgi:hypothetical protein